MAVVSRSGRSRAHCSTILSTPSASTMCPLSRRRASCQEGTSRIYLYVKILAIQGVAMRTPILFVTALTPAVWGTTYAVTAEFLPPGRPLLAGVLRALPAGLLLLAVTRRLPRGSWWWRSAVLGALNIGVFFALLFAAA